MKGIYKTMSLWKSIIITSKNDKISTVIRLSIKLCFIIVAGINKKNSAIMLIVIM